ncbi:MAG: hypothetical protein AMJ54_07130 [Deltaproteobacteria bacterium SG8_13]|nr:MAG: hypothetical protein AMJ54_07130 [Deltaproteobacteria bacterium SG8_13]
MEKFEPEEIERRKKAIFDSMSPRAQQRIRKKGYEKWDPFQEPKDPIDIRRDKTRRTTQQLVREFLQSRGQDPTSNSYGRGVLEIALGLVNEEERFVAMFEFSCWYRELLEKEQKQNTE